MAKPNVLMKKIWLLLVIAGLLVFLILAYAQQEQRGQTSYMKVDITEPFASIMARMTAAVFLVLRENMTKPAYSARQQNHPTRVGEVLSCTIPLSVHVQL